MRQKIAEIIENIKEVESRPDYTLPYQVADQILALPITASFPCPECGGNPTPVTFRGKPVRKACPSHCRDGVVEKTLVAVEMETCKYRTHAGCVVKCENPSPFNANCQRPYYIPLTYATWQNYKFEDMERRVM